jgi:hypothetical protein
VPFLLITLYCLLPVLSIVGYTVSFGLVDSVPWHALVKIYAVLIRVLANSC